MPRTAINGTVVDVDMTDEHWQIIKFLRDDFVS